MDRIMDSGSIDWGSTPHGCTNLTLYLLPLSAYTKDMRLVESQYKYEG